MLLLLFVYFDAGKPQAFKWGSGEKNWYKRLLHSSSQKVIFWRKMTAYFSNFDYFGEEFTKFNRYTNPSYHEYFMRVRQWNLFMFVMHAAVSLLSCYDRSIPEWKTLETIF